MTQPFDPAVIFADVTINKDWLNIVAGSVLATAVVVVVIVFREKNKTLRLIFGLVSLALIGWAIWLFTEAEAEKTKQGPQVTECKRTLAAAQAVARTKLLTVHNEADARAIAQSLIDLIDNSPCKP